jgi:uncharacterized membrane protein
MAMQSTLIVALLCAVFAATHIGLATDGVRAWMIGRLGENRWVWAYGIVASVLFGLTMAYYAGHRFDGPPGPSLGAAPAMRWALIALSMAGMALMGSIFAGYFDSPYAVFAHNFREPYGIERITRHPFFAGTVMFGVAHALLSSHLNGAIVFSSLAALAAAGARHQDAKLLRRGGESYRRFLEATSMVPFAAIVAGRQRVVWRELPVAGLTAGLAVAAALGLVHDSIFAHGGLFVIAAVVGGAAIITLASYLRGRPQSRAGRA